MLSHCNNSMRESPFKDEREVWCNGARDHDGPCNFDIWFSDGVEVAE